MEEFLYLFFMTIYIYIFYLKNPVLRFSSYIIYLLNNICSKYKIITSLFKAWI